MSSFTFDPYIPWSLWLTMALAAVGLLTWYAISGRNRLPKRRWWCLVALMTAAIVAPLIILLNPTWQELIPPPPGKPLLTVLVDRSAGMCTQDAENGQTRFQSAVAIAAKAARELGDRYEVQVRSFADNSTLYPIENLQNAKPDGLSTDIATAIDDALTEDRAEGQVMLLLSDGIHNALGGSERLRHSVDKAKAIAAPVFVKTIGGNAGVNDIEIDLQQPQELAFIGQRVPVAVNVRQRGKSASRIGLSLILDDKIVEKHDVDFKRDEMVEDVFYVTHKTNGLYRYKVRADSFPWEVTPVNNSASLLLRVVDQPVRVLLLEGKPYWDTKFLVRTLSMDQSVELVTVVRLAEGRLLERKIPRPKAATTDDATAEIKEIDDTQKDSESDKDKALAADQWTIEKDAGKFLADAQSLASYQIVILGRNAEIFLTEDSLGKLKK